MITQEAAVRLNRAAIGLQKRLEIDRIATQHKPRFAAFFRNQKTRTLEEFRKYQFLFTESYRALREEVRPNEFLTTHDWDRLWQEVGRDTFDELQKTIVNTEADGLIKGALQFKKILPTDKTTFNLANPRAVEWFLKNGGSVDYIKGINTTTSNQIKTIIRQAIDEGWSYTQTAKEISDKFDEFSRERAKSIAIYETGSAYEQGNMLFAQSLEDDGIRMVKTWMTSHDDQVSEGCQENEDEGPIPINQYHRSGHMQPPRFPGRGGSGGCRCYEIYEQAPAN